MRIHAPELYLTVRVAMVMIGLVLMVYFGAGKATDINIDIALAATGAFGIIDGRLCFVYERSVRKKYQADSEKKDAEQADT